MQAEHRPGLRGGPRKKASRDRVVVDGEAGQAERPSTCPAVLRESGGGRTHALFVDDRGRGEYLVALSLAQFGQRAGEDLARRAAPAY